MKSISRHMIGCHVALAATLLASVSISYASVSNIPFHTGADFQFADDLTSGPNRAGQNLANPFLTGSSILSLDNITVDLAGGFGSGFTVSLYDDASGLPGSSLLTLNGSSTPDAGGLFAYTPSVSYTLLPNTTYWAVFTVPHSAPDKQFPVYTVSNLGQTGDTGWSIGDNYASQLVNNGIPSGWSADSGNTPLEFAVNTSAAPEPSTWTFFAIGVVALTGMNSVRRNRSDSRRV